MNLELLGGITGILVVGFGGFCTGLDAGRDMTRAKDAARIRELEAALGWKRKVSNIPFCPTCGHVIPPAPKEST